MIHNVVQFGNILCMSFESFGELHFRPTFDAGAVRRCIAIVRAIQADCLATIYSAGEGTPLPIPHQFCFLRHSPLGSTRRLGLGGGIPPQYFPLEPRLVRPSHWRLEPPAQASSPCGISDPTFRNKSMTITMAWIRRSVSRSPSLVYRRHWFGSSL